MQTSRTTWALVALVVGLPAGIAIEATRSAPLLRVVSGIEPLGTPSVNGVRMTIVPLIISLLVVGVASGGASIEAANDAMPSVDPGIASAP